MCKKEMRDAKCKVKAVPPPHTLGHGSILTTDISPQLPKAHAFGMGTCQDGTPLSFGAVNTLPWRFTINTSC